MMLGRIASFLIYSVAGSQFSHLHFFFPHGDQLSFFILFSFSTNLWGFFRVFSSFLISWNDGVDFTICNIYFVIFIGTSNRDLVGNGEFPKGGGGGGGWSAKVVKSNGCSRLSVGLPSPLP
ncbi:hypothetical protein COP2_030111 [Malus domestica]